MPQKRWAIPTDWDKQRDGYISVLFCIPNSQRWRGLIVGLISSLSFGWNWDGKTGNIKDTQKIAKEIFESMEMGCLEELIKAQQETNKLLRLQVEALTGGSVDFAGGDLVVPGAADYSANGLVPAIKETAGQLEAKLDNLAQKFETDNWVLPNETIADVLANSLFGKYVNIPNPIAGKGVADILDDEIKTLHKRFTMRDFSILDPLGQKNITEALEALLRVDNIGDVELLPNIATIAQNTMTVGDSTIKAMLKNLVGKVVKQLSLPKDVTDWLNAKLETKEYLTHADILLMLALAGGNGGDASLTIAHAIKQLDLKTEITINNGCGCSGGCSDCQEVKQLSFDQLLCGDDVVIDA